MPASNAKLSFCVTATGPDLRLVVCLDQTVIWDGYPTAETITVQHDFDDSEQADHVLSLEMRGKRSEHTKLDSTGTILEDRCIEVSDISFDDIPLGHLITAVSQYSHTHNDTTATVTEPFYGTMGCNGRVEIRFSTPIYLWLLENM